MNNKINSVWNKGKLVAGLPPNEWRFDPNGMLIRRQDYGKTTQYGWEIDHDLPKARGGSNDISNLIPMQWRKNREKGDMTQNEFKKQSFLEVLRKVLPSSNSCR